MKKLIKRDQKTFLIGLMVTAFLVVPAFSLAFFHRSGRSNTINQASPRVEKKVERAGKNLDDRVQKREERTIRKLDDTREKRALQNGSRESREDEIRQKREERAQKREERRQEVRQKISERRKKLIRAFWNRVVRRIEAAIKRYRRFIKRIESRMDKFDERGKDTAEARAQLALGVERLNNAETLLVSAKRRANEAIESENPKAAFAEVRSIVREVINAIKESHKAIVKTLRILRGASRPTVSPTPASSASPSLSPSPSKLPHPSPIESPLPRLSPSTSPFPNPTIIPTP